MLFRLVADALVVLHFAFILFVVAGGLLAWRWPRLAWIHAPAAVWGALIEFRGWTCPLTPLENQFRRMAGDAGYAGGFIEHYVIPVIYPSGLTQSVQIMLGLLVIAVNVAVYAGLFVRRRAKRASAENVGPVTPAR
ncbi:MAG TPA: DUF2784 domain-containing protein [Gemmatimonadales bacterium]|nr:DUF2784 domain-containing protein [Gemmatimonadales bacterium]